MEARTAKMTSERSLGIELDPEILRAFRASSAVSSKWHALDLTIIFISKRGQSHTPDEGDGKEKTVQSADQG